MSNSIMDITNIDTAALLPSALTEDTEIAAILAAIDDRWKEIAQVIPKLGVLATIDQQPDEVLNKLAWQFHVDYWDDTWSLSIKRQVIRDSFRLHRIAGTRGAVEDVIDSVWGGSAILSEWWQHGDEPGTFTVTLTSEQTSGNVDLFTSSIRKVKRATDHMTIIIATTYDAAMSYSGAVMQRFQAHHLGV